MSIPLWQYVALIGTGFIFGFVTACILYHKDMLAQEQMHHDELGLKVQQEIARRIQGDR